ncbi:inositol transporter 4, partial [Phtheirospermum japonicum]
IKQSSQNAGARDGKNLILCASPYQLILEEYYLVKIQVLFLMRYSTFEMSINLSTSTLSCRQVIFIS